MGSKKQIIISNVKVGGGAPVVVQSMTNTDTRDWKSTLEQLHELTKAGCEIGRVAVPDVDAANALIHIVKDSKIPVVADIHFDHSLALVAIDAGISALRINPGNIGSKAKVAEVARAAKYNNVPIRVGANSGSLPKDLLRKYEVPCAEALVDAALREVRVLEDEGFDKIKISVKSSDIQMTVDAYTLLSMRTSYPLHLGLTEAGPMLMGSIKSTAALIPLLKDGIGDTIRVSLTAHPKYEVMAAYEILHAAGVRKRRGPEIISCPTCGRRSIDVEKLVANIMDEHYIASMPLKIAVMGCPVNGPGEAKHADVGVAGGGGKGIVFRKGEIVRTCDESELEEELKREIETIIKNGC